MPAVSRVIVVCSEARVSESVRYGFERAGSVVTARSVDDAMAGRLVDARPEQRPVWPDLVVAGTGVVETTTALLGALRQTLDQGQQEVPILCLGPSALSRSAALAAGADELLPQPVFVRDAVTIGQLLVGAARARRRHMVEGHLSDYGGVFFLIRAMAAMGRSAVLGMVRGLRRGELRFYRGEITSAQVGVLHGLAAVHQLLLWSRAHFELRDEEVVPRRQIPLSASEILADAERFLHEMRSVMGALAPSEVYELVPEEVEGVTASIPAPVYRIVQLIDGFRTMADVVEDSPYRVLETLRMANRLAELGWIRRATSHDTKTPLGTRAWRRSSEISPSVSVEQILASELSEVSSASIGTVELESIPGTGSAGVVGDDPDDASEPDEEAPDESGEPNDSDESDGGEPAGEDAGEAGEREIDWSDVLPIEMSTGFSPVVPSTSAAGEIFSREQPAGGGSADVVGRDPAVVAEIAHERAATTRRNKPTGTQAARSRAGDPPSVPDAPVTAEPEVAPSLWKRLFGRKRNGDAAAETPRPGGKRGGKRRSRS
jgi:hypothetical protein